MSEVTQVTEWSEWKKNCHRRCLKRYSWVYVDCVDCVDCVDSLDFLYALHQVTEAQCLFSSPSPQRKLPSSSSSPVTECWTSPFTPSLLSSPSIHWHFSLFLLAKSNYTLLFKLLAKKCSCCCFFSLPHLLVLSPLHPHRYHCTRCRHLFYFQKVKCKVVTCYWYFTPSREHIDPHFNWNFGWINNYHLKRVTEEKVRLVFSITLVQLQLTTHAILLSFYLI